MQDTSTNRLCFTGPLFLFFCFCFSASLCGRPRAPSLYRCAVYSPPASLHDAVSVSDQETRRILQARQNGYTLCTNMCTLVHIRAHDS